MIRFVTLSRWAFALAVLSIGGHAALAKTDTSLPFRGARMCRSPASFRIRTAFISS